MNANGPCNLSAPILAHYSQRAEVFRAGRCHPRTSHKRALRHVEIGLNGTARFVEMAHAERVCEVWQQDFLRHALPGACFDGICADASLFHVRSARLPRTRVWRKPRRADGSRPG